MEILIKRPWLVYVLCFFIAFGPALFVWLNYPAIESSDPKEKETQLVYISMLSLLPFIGVLSYIFYKAFKRYLRI